jgi:hypothetical protein
MVQASALMISLLWRAFSAFCVEDWNGMRSTSFTQSSIYRFPPVEPDLKKFSATNQVHIIFTCKKKNTIFDDYSDNYSGSERDMRVTRDKSLKTIS